MKKISALPLLLIPVTIFFGMQLKGRSYYLTSTMVILETMLPFFLSFEGRKPQARELVLIAVMCALAVASRVVVPIPSFKPIFAVIMVTGMALGAEAGFMTGAMAAFASNFFYSQGPWTPWQMLAYGICGFLFGLLKRKPKKIWLAIYGVVCVVLITGPILDCSTLFATSSRLSWKFAALVFAAGFPNNVSNGIATGLTLYFFGDPLLMKLNRMIKKYGLMTKRHA